MTDSSSSLPDPFWTPATDAVLQPPTFPPPPDPVLAPPWLPPSWDQAPPPPPPPAPAPEPPAAAAPATPRRRTRSSSAPVRQAPAPAHQPPVLQHGRGTPTPGRRRSRRGLWIAIPVVLAVCGPALTNLGRNVADVIRDATTPATSSAAPPPVQLPILPAESGPTVPITYPTPTTTVDEKTPAAFGLAIGSGVRVTRGANQWVLSVVDVAFVQGTCDQYPGADRVIALAVRLDIVSGRTTVAPYNDLVYTDPTGRVRSGLVACGVEQALVLEATAGQSAMGTILYADTTGGGGELAYRPGGDSRGSWTIPTRPA